MKKKQLSHKEMALENNNDIILSDFGQKAYTQKRIDHWNAVARKMDTWTGWGKYYHQRLTQIHQFLVVPGQRVLEVGCGQGDLLSSLKPVFGVGVDFSREMIQRARRRHPELHFVQCDTHDLCLSETFDVIIFSDVVNDLWDVQSVFEHIRQLTTPHTRVLLNFYSHLWEKPLTLARRLGWAKPNLSQNWLTLEDISNLLYLADFEVIRYWEEILWPFSTPFLAPLANYYLVKFWPFKMFAMTNFIIARPCPQPEQLA